MYWRKTNIFSKPRQALYKIFWWIGIFFLLQLVWLEIWNLALSLLNQHVVAVFSSLDPTVRELFIKVFVFFFFFILFVLEIQLFFLRVNKIMAKSSKNECLIVHICNWKKKYNYIRNIFSPTYTKSTVECYI